MLARKLKNHYQVLKYEYALWQDFYIFLLKKKIYFIAKFLEFFFFFFAIIYYCIELFNFYSIFLLRLILHPPCLSTKHNTFSNLHFLLI